MSIDATTDALARQIKAAVESRFGDALDAVYLFGSRARGDHRPDSDLDVAVVLRHVENSLAAADLELLDITYPLEIATATHVQAWALPSEALSSVTADGPSALAPSGLRRRLADTIRREGIRV
jgi:predicted nucleotidyltransferase